MKGKNMLLASALVSLTGCEFGYDSHGAQEVESHQIHEDAGSSQSQSGSGQGQDVQSEQKKEANIKPTTSVPSDIVKIIETGIIASECAGIHTKVVTKNPGIFSFPPKYYTKTSQLIHCRDGKGKTFSIAAYGYAPDGKLTTLQTLTDDASGYVSISHSTDKDEDLEVRQVDKDAVNQDGTFKAYTRSIRLRAGTEGKCTISKSQDGKTEVTSANDCTSIMEDARKKLYKNWPK